MTYINCAIIQNAMLTQDFGKTLIIIGIVILVAGIFLSSGAKLPWIGKLPGDIAIRRENFSFYFPLTTCILFSILMTVLFKFFGRQ